MDGGVMGWREVWSCIEKEKTAYGMRLSLVGSEMCIRDRHLGALTRLQRLLELPGVSQSLPAGPPGASRCPPGPPGASRRRLLSSDQRAPLCER